MSCSLASLDGRAAFAPPDSVAPIFRLAGCYIHSMMVSQVESIKVQARQVARSFYIAHILTIVVTNYWEARGGWGGSSRRVAFRIELGSRWGG